MNNPLYENLVAIRRTIHENPELGYQEMNTSKLICRELDTLGIPYKKNIAKTGVIATVNKGEGPCIVLRADMDALPLQEETNLPFASKTANVMHACGHDVHTTMLLGAAHLLKEAEFKGSVKLIFQPSEEGVYDDPEKKSGGQRIAESGEIEVAMAAIALHVHPLLEVGKIAFKLGQALACTNFFRITITGKESHAGAAPHLGIDAILISSHIIQAAQSIVSRYTSPNEPVVISFTKINGGVAPNIIAAKVVLEGTIRALDISTYEQVLERLETMISGLWQCFSAEDISIQYDLNYPSLLNDKNLHVKLEPSLNKIFGSDNINEIDAMLGGEDFAFFSRKIPSMFYFLGAKAATPPPHHFLHHPKVIINEECIKYGAQFMAEAAVDLLKDHSS